MTHLVRNCSTQSRGVRPGRPVQLHHCAGVYEYTTDGREILSWPMGQHGALLGYPHLESELTGDLVRKLSGQMFSGNLSLGSYAPAIEEELAELLCTRYRPYSTSDLAVRFASNGTDVTQAAVALARHATGRNRILSIGYHGGSSPVFNFPPQAGGVIAENRSAAQAVAFEEYFNWRERQNDYIMSSFAAIAVEVPSSKSESHSGFVMEMISKDCQRYGAHLVLDDVVTGFRMSPAGAIQFYEDCRFGYSPFRADFICLGKSMSTFGKVSALLGPQSIMADLADKVFMSYTYSDHPFGMFDSLETIKTYDRLGDYMYMYLDKIGTALKDGLNEVFTRRGFNAEVYGHPSRTAIDSAEPRYWEFLSTLVDEENVLIHRPQFSTLAHTMDDVEKTVSAVDRVLGRMGYRA